MSSSSGAIPSGFPSSFPSGSPSSVVVANITESFIEAEKAEKDHEFNAEAAFTLNLTIIACLLLAYAIKKFQIYSLPESAGALLVGVIVGGMARLAVGVQRLDLFEFQPEVFFFVLLPPIIFEAGYSLDRKGFFDNIGAITLFAIFGTFLSTFVVGYLCFIAAQLGLVAIDDENPMEALIFGALISSVDPVATLSIMGNEDLNVDPLLYSLVFGESVLNDAVAISLFKTFFRFYNPEISTPDVSYVAISLSFIFVFGCSILVGVGIGLCASWLFKHTELRMYPNLETSLLMCFCYLCYAVAEAIGLSGIMALFSEGVCLSHYNAYNLSMVAHVASEQIFSTFATLTETIVFIYMGMEVFTGGFQNFSLSFLIVAFTSCLVGRAINIFPLSFLANFCRERSNKITGKMQVVLWFAGLRGAIAFALSENMPGPHQDVYKTTTLTICIITTVFCGGFTERMLTVFGMREEPTPKLGYGTDPEDDGLNLNSLTYKPPVAQPRETPMMQRKRRIADGIKGVWYRFDDRILKKHFGGERELSTSHKNRTTNDYSHDSFPEKATGRDGSNWPSPSRGNYEMRQMNGTRMGVSSNGNNNSTEEMVSLTASFDVELENDDFIA
ncbi:unnamed protein product [Pseudo-nitzschia multistriata]|uniref:Sodium/hydrogen exchanger n=1 Tax=Pseudo-nitzschia multistriata TaxID=183589 RepID=A0A448ZKR2_9STRA|nr:unnamed protein product [Pseudo-nitzschia multistriata]